MKAAALVFLLLAGAATAADIRPATCSLADVTAAVASAADGDRVLLPAGSCSWSSPLTLSKGVAIEGAGMGLTVINVARFNVTSSRPWAVGGITFQNTAGFNITGSSMDGRIHHNDFTGVQGFTQNRTLWIEPQTATGSAGVIDHNVFNKPKSIQIHVRERAGNGNASWMRALNPGGKDAWYIENNTFSQDPSTYNVSLPLTDCDGGGRMVIRKNTIYSNYSEMHDGIISGLRGCRKMEVYGNAWTTPQSVLNQTGQYAQIAIRGAWVAVFDNTFAASTSYDLIFSNYRTGGQTAGKPWDKTCQSSGAGTSTLNSTTQSPGYDSPNPIKIDGSGGPGLPTNYPCRDQMGTDGNNPQTVLPALFWNNTRNGTLVAPQQRPYSDNAYLVAGRDYCAGASKPSTCGGKAVTYQPYTYPHPLVSGTGPGPTPVDCVVSWGAWVPGAWSACAAGTQTRTETRTGTVTTPASNGGAACPALTQTRTVSQPCSTPVCPAQPMKETRNGCPTGTTGYWEQKRVWNSAAYPTCWVQTDWTPEPPPPAGVCVGAAPIPKYEGHFPAGDCVDKPGSPGTLSCAVTIDVKVVP